MRRESPKIRRQYSAILACCFGLQENKKEKKQGGVFKEVGKEVLLCVINYRKVMPSSYASGSIFIILNPFCTILPYVNLDTTHRTVEAIPKADLHRHRWRQWQVICLSLDS